MHTISFVSKEAKILTLSRLYAERTDVAAGEFASNEWRRLDIGGEFAFERVDGGFATDGAVDFYLNVVKRAEFFPLVKSLNVSADDGELLLAALVAYKRDRDELIIRSALRRVNAYVLSLDGFYNFRLKGLRARWSELSKTVKANAALLKTEGGFVVTLGLLVAEAGERTASAHVGTRNGEYSLSANGKTQKLGGNELLCELIRLSPRRVVVGGDILDDRISGRLYALFDVTESRE